MGKISYQKLPLWKYRLVANYEIKLPELTALQTPTFSHPYFTFDGETLTIRSGYTFDGASGPTIDTPDSMRGALVHDALYQAMREGYLSTEFRPAADLILERLLKEDGMNPFRARYWYLAVKHLAPMFGALSRQDNTIYTAP